MRLLRIRFFPFTVFNFCLILSLCLVRFTHQLGECILKGADYKMKSCHSKNL